ncbi:hypothetical protein EDD15DRAFT_956388 [Pisolithus albus]|nr:hypothetical protein EDD15DRAFT_956388 [Pisolithus albus]
MDAYDTLIAEATLHGAEPLKKPHQAIAVLVICCDRGRPPGVMARGRTTKTSECRKHRETGAFPYQDSKRVLECLQKTLRIATSATEDIVTVQLYCNTRLVSALFQSLVHPQYITLGMTSYSERSK